MDGCGVGLGVGVGGWSGWSGVGVGAGLGAAQEGFFLPGVLPSLPSQAAGSWSASKQLLERSHAQLGAAHVGRPSGTAPEKSFPLR